MSFLRGRTENTRRPPWRFNASFGTIFPNGPSSEILPFGTGTEEPIPSPDGPGVDVSSDETRESEQNSVTGWIAGLQTGDAEAVRHLWDRYAQALVQAARERLGNSPRRAADEEDVVISVFAALCRGAEAGRFADLRNRDDLWWLLLTMTHRKAISQMRKETAQKRGGKPPDGETPTTPLKGNSLNISFEELISDEPTGEYLTILKDQHDFLSSLLRNDDLRRIAQLRVEGWTIREIATHVSRSVRSVERKLELIRETWRQALREET